MWEVIEHIKQSKLNDVFQNVKKHLSPGGIFILSVSPISDVVDGVELHQTIKPKSWWDKKIKEYGFINNPWVLDYLGTDLLRLDSHSVGNRNATASFHYALTSSESPLSLSDRGKSIKEILINSVNKDLSQPKTF